MRVSAALGVARADGSPGSVSSRITRLRSDPPLVLRPSGPAPAPPPYRWDLGGPAVVRAALAAGAAGPVGGDHLRLDVQVGAEARLVLRGVAATMALPGPHHEPSRTDVTITVGQAATLVWLPGPLIAVRGCDHRTTTRIELGHGARLLVRDELLLGRSGEPPGAVRQRLRISLDGRPLHDQELRIGAGAPGWDGPAVTGGRRGVGSMVLVDPAWEGADSRVPVVCRDEADTVRLPLEGPAVLLTALAPDGLTLRRRLDTALAELEAAAG